MKKIICVLFLAMCLPVHSADDLTPLETAEAYFRKLQSVEFNDIQAGKCNEEYFLVGMSLVEIVRVKTVLRGIIESMSPDDYEFYLSAAIVSNSIDGIKRALKTNPSLEIAGPSTALHLAAQQSEPKTLRYLLSLGLIHIDTNLNAPNAKGTFTPLDAAVMSNERENLDVLLEAGANINATTLLANISICRDEAMFRYLVEQGAEVDDLARQTADKMGLELEE